MVGWAILGGALALFAKRGSVAVLVGTLIAIVGTAVKITAVLVLAAGILGAGAGSGGSAALATVARTAALIIFCVGAAGSLLLLRVLLRGTRERPRAVFSAAGDALAAVWRMAGNGREWADEVVTDAALGARIRACFGSRAGGVLGVRRRERAAVQAAAPGALPGAVGSDARPFDVAGTRAGAARPGVWPAGSGAAGGAAGVLGTTGGQRRPGGVAADDADFERRAVAFRAEMDRLNGRV